MLFAGASHTHQALHLFLGLQTPNFCSGRSFLPIPSIRFVRLQFAPPSTAISRLKPHRYRLLWWQRVSFDSILLLTSEFALSTTLHTPTKSALVAADSRLLHPSQWLAPVVLLSHPYKTTANTLISYPIPTNRLEHPVGPRLLPAAPRLPTVRPRLPPTAPRLLAIRSRLLTTSPRLLTVGPRPLSIATDHLPRISPTEPRLLTVRPRPLSIATDYIPRLSTWKAPIMRARKGPLIGKMKPRRRGSRSRCWKRDC